ncbi:MAG: peptidyl-prolyl cis-trans isomerase [Planctomycetota bacterium]
MRLLSLIAVLVLLAGDAAAQPAPGATFNIPGLTRQSDSIEPGEVRVPGLTGPGIDDVKPVDDCEVIARVNGQVVTACEVLWQVNLMLEGQLDRIPPEHRSKVRNQLMRQHLMGMLDMKMLYGDFRRKAPQADIKAIQESLAEKFDEEEIPKLMKEVGVKQERKLPARLAELGTSLRDRRLDFYQTMIARGWMQEQATFPREVTYDELVSYYQEHSADYEYPTRARWEELVVMFSRHKTKAKAYAKLAALGNRAYQAAVALPDKNDPAFGDLAKQESEGFNADEGGLYEWTTQGALAAERIDQAIFSLPVGEMSPILESNLGFHIVRVVERQQAGRKPFTDVQSEIRQRILDARGKEAFSAKLAALRAEAQIWTKWDGYVSRNGLSSTRSPGGSRR